MDLGHLCELKEPNDYAVNWKHWSLAALPMIPARFGIKLIEDEGIKKTVCYHRTPLSKCR